METQGAEGRRPEEGREARDPKKECVWGGRLQERKSQSPLEKKKQRPRDPERGRDRVNAMENEREQGRPYEGQM